MQAIIDRLDAQFADPGYRYALLRREDWQTLKTVVLAQQANNNARDEICSLIDAAIALCEGYLGGLAIPKLTEAKRKLSPVA